jgi:hypothetical protein
MLGRAEGPAGKCPKKFVAIAVSTVLDNPQDIRHWEKLHVDIVFPARRLMRSFPH